MKSIPDFCRRLLTLCMLMSVILVSCNKDSVTSTDRRSQLISELPDDAVITLAFSPAAVLKSAGMEVSPDGVKPTKSLEKLVASNKSLSSIVDFITGAKGIDYSAAVVAGGTTNGYVLFALSDVHRFTDWAEDKGMTITNNGSLIVCYKGISAPAIVVDGETAWFIGSAVSPDKAVEIVKNNKAAAADNKIADWKVDRLMNDDDINVIVNIEAYSKEMTSALSTLGISNSLANIYGTNCKYSSAEINFDGPTIRLTGEGLDEAGKPTAIFAEGTYTIIPSEAISLVKDSQIAFGFTFYDAWKNMMAELANVYRLDKEYRDIISQVFSSVKAITMGFATKGKSFTNPTDILATMAVDYDKPEAEKAVSMLLPLAKQFNIDKNLTDGWNAFCGKSTYVLTPESSMPALKVYITGRDGLGLISTDKSISDVKISPDPKLDGLIAYSVIDIEKSHPLLALANCPFGIDSKFTSTNEKSEGYITLTETDGPILETLISFISRFL